jgi:Flp pilus assembly protein TadG
MFDVSAPSRLGALASDQQGAVLVIFALFAPVAILLAAFTMDAGNWFLHKRHLQVQADAAVFAAAREFQPCLDTSVYSRAGQYGGAGSVSTPSGTVSSTTPLRNEQVGGTAQSNIHELINSKRYYEQSSPVDSTAVEQPPCAASMVDVKLTETDVPWYWRVLSTVPHINAHARIEILQELNPAKVEPLAVVESAPIAAEAYFVNEDNNSAVIAKTPLKNLGPNGQGQDVWANSETPLAVSLAKTNGSTAHIGVLIALSGKKSDTTCPTHEYVKCFDESKGPLLHVAGYSSDGTGTVTAPLARKVALSNPSPNTCTDGYFSNASSNCTFTISAKLDYGSAITKGMTIFPQIGGTKEKTSLTFNAGTGLWTGTASLPAGSGSREVSLVVECKKEAGSPCEKTSNSSATIKNVHRIYAASESGSGPITGAWISEVGGAAQGANSFEACEGCTHKLVVTVDVGGSLADAQKFSDPVYHMRFGSPQAEVVGCEPGKEASGSDYRDSLSKGCQHRYKINTSDPNCTSKTEPYDCIGFASGVKTGPFSQGLEKRLATEVPSGTKYYCANNWTNSNAGGVPLLPGDDSRIIQVFIEPYAANGSKSVPIQDFATFYVTGWDGDGCKSTTHPDDAAGKGEVVGHFVKYINTLGNQEGGGPKCSLNSLGQCVAVLTR